MHVNSRQTHDILKKLLPGESFWDLARRLGYLDSQIEAERLWFKRRFPELVTEWTVPGE